MNGELQQQYHKFIHNLSVQENFAEADKILKTIVSDKITKKLDIAYDAAEIKIKGIKTEQP